MLWLTCGTHQKALLSSYSTEMTTLVVSFKVALWQHTQRHGEESITQNQQEAISKLNTFCHFKFRSSTKKGSHLQREKDQFSLFLPP